MTAEYKIMTNNVGCQREIMTNNDNFIFKGSLGVFLKIFF